MMKKCYVVSAGFTLIEVMVVIVILGLLAAIIAPKIMDNPDKARVVRAQQDIQTIASALQLYKLDNFVYPTTDQGLEALIQQPTTPPVPKHWKPGGYLEQLPLDPWDHPYQYLQPGVHNTSFDVYTLGADGQPDGEGLDADIGNWNRARTTTDHAQAQ